MRALKVLEIPEDRPVLSLELPANTSFDEWVAIGRRLCLGSQAVNWHIGDWWLFGVKHWGEVETRKSVLKLWGVEGETARVYGWVAAKFDPVNRLTDLSFTHYQRAASLPSEDAKRLIERASAERLSVRDVQREVQSAQPQKRRPVSDDYLIQQKAPAIATEIAAEAERLGKKLPDFLAFLLALGWQQYLATRDGG